MSRSICTGVTTESASRAMFRGADAVCFDVDSTVCMDEAIDELAQFAGREQEVAALTQKAMRGGLTFQDALSQRLDLIQPTVYMIEDYLQSHPPRLTLGIGELVKTLHDRGVNVFLISGGFRSIIEPVADQLQIPYKNIFANRLKFYLNGEYAGFDETQPTAYQDGKGRVISCLKKKFGYRRVVMVGDGVTDLNSCPPADGFIGFGGNQVREKVKQDSKWFVYSFQELLMELNRN